MPALRLHRHGVVLLRPLLRAAVLSAAGALLVHLGWPLSPIGAAALALAALVMLRAVWRWERTVVEVTSDEVRLTRGTLRRRSRAVARGDAPVELDQGFAGRLLGYGTVTVGGLELDHVPRARALARLLAQRPQRAAEEAADVPAATAASRRG